MMISEVPGTAQSRPPRVEYLKTGGANRLARDSHFLQFNKSSVVSPPNTAASNSVDMQHDSSYYNQYASNHYATVPNANLQSNTVTHCEIRLPPSELATTTTTTALDTAVAPSTTVTPEAPQIAPPIVVGLSLVMDCRLSYLRGGGGDPHGGGLLQMGRFGVSRALLADQGLIDNEWHCYCIRVTNEKASVLIDWEREVIVNNTGVFGYLDDFYSAPETTLDIPSDRACYQASNQVSPRLITLFAAYSDNGQMGVNKLSMYARADGQVKQVHVWDYCVPIRQARHRYSPLIDKVPVPMALLIKESVSRPSMRLPDSLLAIIAEYLWDDSSYGNVRPMHLIDNLVKYFFAFNPGETSDGVLTTVTTTLDKTTLA